MIRLGLIILAVFYLALPVMAQSVQVRSGEHADFSRLTLNLPERIGWSVVPSAQGAHVLFSSTSTLSIDTGVIFDRIPRKRLIDVQWNAERRRLELSFECDCAVTGFWFGESMLVLDISDQDSGNSADSAQTGLALEFDAPDQTPSRATSLLTPFPGESRPGRPGPVWEAALKNDKAQINKVRDLLLRQISRATAQGLLAPRQRLRDPALAAADPEVPLTGSVAPGGPMSDPAKPLVNLRVNSRIDLDLLGSLRSTDRQRVETGCLSDDKIDVAAWGSDAPFGQQIAPLRLRLTDEIDQMNEIAVRQLAQLYLFFGFGAEARQVLDLLNESDASVDLLLALSDIAEHGFAEPGSQLAGQLHCGSLAAFWSSLSYKDLPQDTLVDTDAILLGFNALPSHLRRYYGPILSGRFIVAQRPDVAARILRIVERGEGQESGEIELAKAQTELAKGAIRPATKRLESIVDSNVESSAAALIEMIETRVRQGEPVLSEQAQLAGAFAFEKRNEVLAPALHAAHIRALAASGAFDEAHDVYSERARLIEPDQRPVLQADLARYLTRDADDMTFLRLAFSGAFDHTRQPDPLVANAMAGRMLALGFPEQAGKLLALEAPERSETLSDRRLLRGEIALALGQPRQALVQLLDLDGASANLLRARALVLAGDHREALAIFKSAGAEDEARVAALLGGLWTESVTPEPDFSEAELETMVPASTGPISDTSPPALASTRALLDSSSAARQALSQLLMTYPHPQTASSAR